MKKLLLATVLTFSFAFTSISQAEENKDNNTASVEITPDENLNKSLITPKIISLDISGEPEQKSYSVKCLGLVTNKTNSVLKNINVTVQFVDVNKNVLDQVDIQTIERIEVGQEVSFKVEKTLNTEINRFNIRAIAKLKTLQSANTMKIAELILQGKREELQYWDTTLSDSDLKSDTDLRYYALGLLTQVSEKDPDYNKAQDMINEIHYVEGLKSLEVEDYPNAFISLTKVNPSQKYGELAENAIGLYRHKIIYEKAKKLILNREYMQAIPLLRSIPVKSQYYKTAKTELKNIYYHMTKKKLGFIPLEVEDLSTEQANVVKLMEMNPEYKIENFPSKNFVTLVFPDYSRFFFNSEGKLVGYKMYPLF